MKTYKLIFPLCLTLTACSTVIATDSPTGWVPPDPTACQIDGWVTETHHAGVMVRAAPSGQAPVLGVLPARVANQDSFDYGPEFEIIGSHNGWLKIQNAWDDPARSNLPERPTYSGIGWIPGEQAGFGIQYGSGYLRPDPQSKRLIHLGSDWLTERGQIHRVVACKDEWVLVDFTILSDERFDALLPDDQIKGRAWFKGVCANQETTCDGIPANTEQVEK
ncbi:SH3 domain-containing protein [Hahella sp. CR1]|uniref:SH3 domain-containing protein n=1 Tax=Hahella sp. CR1 TaxID=2992807 RepID=UPI002441D91F|nr:SH3 domain-containing protein [Hahella sp. CR1]MDG9669186.1 SH3 domain-containing protein [Hahella sp. CR1]